MLGPVYVVSLLVYVILLGNWPELQRGGGLDPVLMELSDLLPAQVFELEGLD